MPLVAWAIGVVGLGLNPHGYAHVDFLVRTTLVDRPEILDWLPLDLLSPPGIAYLVLTSLTIFSLGRQRKSVSWPLVLPLTGLLIAPLIATRHLQLFVPAVSILAGPYIGTTLSRASAIDQENSKPIARYWLVGGVAAFFGVVAISVAPSIQCLEVDSTQFDFPTRAVDSIPKGTIGNAAVPFNWGEYVIWWRGDELKVSTDGRRETAYSEEVHQMNLDFNNGVGDDWDRLLRAAPTDLVLLPSFSPGAIFMESEPGWMLSYDDGFARIFLPNNSTIVLVEDPAQPIDGAGVCFPDPAS
jgi:hypothetical protein